MPLFSPAVLFSGCATRCFASFQTPFFSAGYFRHRRLSAAEFFAAASVRRRHGRFSRRLRRRRQSAALPPRQPAGLLCTPIHTTDAFHYGHGVDFQPPRRSRFFQQFHVMVPLCHELFSLRCAAYFSSIREFERYLAERIEYVTEPPTGHISLSLLRRISTRMILLRHLFLQFNGGEDRLELPSTYDNYRLSRQKITYFQYFSFAVYYYSSFIFFRVYTENNARRHDFQTFSARIADFIAQQYHQLSKLYQPSSTTFQPVFSIRNRSLRQHISVFISFFFISR